MYRCRCIDVDVSKLCIEALCKLYGDRWGKEVDFLALPAGINIVETLERIIDTGESPIVGWAKIEEENVRY